MKKVSQDKQFFCLVNGEQLFEATVIFLFNQVRYRNSCFPEVSRFSDV
jgi:hypothetical protein